MDDKGIEPKVGSRIRKIRESQKISLRALSERCGLSANAISLIERGENSPTVSSLHQLATGLDVPITDFFQEEISVNAIHVKRAQGLQFQNTTTIIESLGIGLPNQQLEPFRMTIAPGVVKLDDPISHPGEEFVHCLEGEVKYWVGDREFVLNPGDSLLFDATQPHCWKNLNQKPAAVILIFQTAHGDLTAHHTHMSHLSE